MTEEPLIALNQLTVGYEGTAVLENVNLTIEKGSFTGLLGANGSGKSTLIKTILGIIRPVGGEIKLGTPGRSGPIFGYVPQREVLDPIYLVSAFEVVLMGASQRVGPGKPFNFAEKEFALQCLKRTGAENLSGKRFSELSGGQKQRVLIARALATKPDMLVLDEPTAGIDAAAAESIMELLRDLHRGAGMTILMVNHDLQTTRKYVREVIWLHQGKVIKGSVQELLTPEKIEEIFDLQFS